jgi:hypothetical protein
MFTHHDFTIALADERRHHLHRDAAGVRLARAVRRIRRRGPAPSTASPPQVVDLRTRAATPPAGERHPTAA